MNTSPLAHFVNAQAAVWPQVIAELGAGRKRTHWMWFVFPQLRELGRSEMARRFGIVSAAEARDYLAHPLLGPRLVECTRLVLAVEGRSAHDIFGSPDDIKLRSCMTLFAAVAVDQPVFERVLVKYANGDADPMTLELLARRR